MNTITKIRMDRRLGKPIVIILNIIARFLGFLLHIDHSFNKAPKSIAVCKFMGMGNIIQSTPLLQTLRKNFPDARITFITRKSNHEIIELIPCIDKALYINDRSFGSLFLSSVKMIFKLWKKKNDIYIDLETYSHYSTFIATLSLSRNRLSFYRREDHIRLGIYTHMMFFNNNAPISEKYLQMARFIGCKEIIDHLYNFRLKEEDRNIFIKKLASNFNYTPDIPLIILNPNSSDLLKERRWPAENFTALAAQLSEIKSNYKLGFIGSANEISYTKSIIEKIPLKYKSNIIDFSGKLNISELILLTEFSQCVITNDSGPMHIAFSMNVPTIALFGPHLFSDSGNNKTFFFFYKNLYCSPCVHEFLKPPCKGDNICMKQITVEEVKNLTLLFINKEISSGNTVEKSLIYSSGDHPLGIVRR